MIWAVALSYGCSTRVNNCLQVEQWIRDEALTCGTHIVAFGPPLPDRELKTIADARDFSALVPSDVTPKQVNCMKELDATREDRLDRQEKQP